jgi:hypothetical protein
MSRTMSWSDLPYDVMETILSKLSSVRLAQLSLTCKSFSTAYRKLTAAQQRARCKIAFASCGRERISRLLNLIVHLLNRQPLSPVSADGVLHGPAHTLPPQSSHGPEEMLVDVSLEHGIDVKASGSSASSLKVIIYGTSKHAYFSIAPSDDEDVQGVAIVQAMLSLGMAEIFKDAGGHADIGVWHYAEGSTRAGLEAQVAPLLPFARNYTPAAPVYKGFERNDDDNDDDDDDDWFPQEEEEGDNEFFVESMHIGYMPKLLDRNV